MFIPNGSVRPKARISPSSELSKGVDIRDPATTAGFYTRATHPRNHRWQQSPTCAPASCQPPHPRGPVVRHARRGESVSDRLDDILGTGRRVLDEAPISVRGMLAAVYS